MFAVIIFRENNSAFKISTFYSLKQAMQYYGTTCGKTVLYKIIATSPYDISFVLIEEKGNA